MAELQAAYDALKSSSEQQISALQVQVASLRSSAVEGKSRFFFLFVATEKSEKQTGQALMFGC